MGKGRFITILAMIIFSLILVLSGIVLYQIDYTYPRKDYPKEYYPREDEFCGWSTYGRCYSDLDCEKGGCSSQVCHARNEKGIITTCEWRDCYNALKYGLECKCINYRCEWSK